MRNFLLNTAIVILILIGLNFPIAWFIKGHYHTYNKQNWVLQKTGEHNDYAVLGSSRVFNVIDILSMDSAYGKKGINLGVSGGSYAENYILLNEFLKKNQLDKILISTDEFNFNIAAGVEYLFHHYEFLHLFNPYQSVFADYTPKWKFNLWKILPASKFIEFNDQFVLVNKFDSALDRNKGTELLYQWGTKDLAYIHQTKIAETDKKYFFLILDLCEKYKIKIVFFASPIFRISHMPANIPIQHFIDSVCASKKIPFVSATDLIDTDNKNYFFDYRHTNAKGSKIFSAALGAKLRKDGL